VFIGKILNHLKLTLFKDFKAADFVAFLIKQAQAIPASKIGRKYLNFWNGNPFAQSAFLLH
jgi:hypothetical protein